MDEHDDGWRWWRMTVRTRIVAAITLVSAVALLSVGISAYLVERSRILESIDERLAANLESARHIVEAGDDDQNGAWTSADEALAAVVQRMSPDDNTGALGIVRGQPTLAPPVPLDVDLLEVPAFATHAAEAASAGEPVVGTFAEGDVTWRFLAAPIAVSGDGPAEVVFAMVYDVEGEFAEINDAANAYLISAAIALIAITAVATIVSTRLLRPLRRMRETADRITARSLSERLPVDGRDDVADLAATMNAMLDRLDAALDSQRELLSDVGHELKTPITVVRGHLEVMDARDRDDVTQTRELAVDELERMGKLVDDLSRAAALHGPAPIAPREVDAGDLVRGIVHKTSAIEGATVDAVAVADVVAWLDPDRITQAMLQLAQNAVTHGGGHVAIGSAVVDDALHLRVRDHGPGVAGADQSIVFDRFHRGAAGGSGLGLHIVQVIARAHGGAASVSDAVGGGAMFTIVLPGAVRDGGWREIDGVAVPPRPPLPVTSGGA